MANDLVTTRGKAVGTFSATNLPSAIAGGIADLLTAFAAGSQQDDSDKRRLMRLYGEAIADHDAAVAEHALGWLKLHNPRNPFRPTPQDVFETCEKLAKEWRERVLNRFFGVPEPTWGKPETSIVWGREFPWGAAPLTKGCPIPDALVRAYLSAYLDAGAERIKTLAMLGRERLARIPKACFVVGQLEGALEAIEQEERKAAEITRHNAYLATLDPDLRRHRRVVLNTGDNHKLSEAELIAEAKRALERERRENALRAAESEEESKRSLAHLAPEMQAVLDAMRKTARSGDAEARKRAVQDYIAALAKHGAKPPPHLAIEVAQAGWEIA